ncbi:inositol monophosphatase family protein [Alkalihalobacillus trypoxylicola]|uniref:Inositol-1-monophosphatase n=1 Tax=Alkalihalobacillus trypoxylicola TaxID=519424 RepID=A0A161Q9A0_9BACI|nr:inositol monophosphatase family protein [Alkalihalobacillus trypoxylicola]KYG33863.1 hypothetical protein AZF04_15210 [Alkalihalobacillus trypoxylicola]
MMVRTMLLSEVALNVEKLIRRIGDSAMNDVTPIEIDTKKSRSDLVTSVDRELEENLIVGLKELVPEGKVLSEETCSQTMLEEFQWTWVIDPLDGTVNFVHDNQRYCISVALCYGEEPYLSWIYDLSNRVMYKAERGKGAYADDERIFCSNRARLEESLIGFGFSDGVKNHQKVTLHKLEFLLSHCRSVRISGSSCLDFALVATGRLDGFWHYDLEPWDIMAGRLLVSEAGGGISELNSSSMPIKPVCVVAGNSYIHKKLQNTLQL